MVSSRQRFKYNHCTTTVLPLYNISHRWPLDFIVKENDIVKLDLGVHIDGYIAVVAHTVFMSEEKKGKAVDAMLAAHYCAEAALRLVAPGIEVSNHMTVFESNIKCYLEH